MRVIVAMLALLTLVACESQRIEYHTRPEYFHQAAMGDLDDRVTLEDGTVLVFRSRDEALAADRSRNPASKRGERRQYEIREELEDGTIVLRAMIPEHVLANLMACLANEEYELIYNEMLSHHTRDAWEAAGNDIEDFIDYFEEHRNEMMRTVHRLQLGLPRFEAMLERVTDEVMEVRLRSHIAESYRFTRVRVIVDGVGLKLLNIL